MDKEKKRGEEVVGESIGTHVIKAECQQPVPNECSSSPDRTHATLHSQQLKSPLLSLCFSLLSSAQDEMPEDTHRHAILHRNS